MAHFVCSVYRFCLFLCYNFELNVQKMDEICHHLFSWYHEHKRDLPWRNTRNPYHLWISEVILQQTRVAQGYDYFVRFIEHFPTVESLAQAPDDEVMRLWQGLGYYSRARNLHAAAKQVLAMGGFPSSYEAIRSLKGVGDYTAAAVASFAFDAPYAAVDGNVCRVWSRVFGIDAPIDSTPGKRLIADIAQTLLPEPHAALYNQAVMEFGALQCVPRNPNCTVCPLAHKCVAMAEDRVEVLPVKSHKTKLVPRYFHYNYIHNADGLLLHKRMANDIWQNLYELPLIETPEAMEVDDFLRHPDFGVWHSLIPYYIYRGHVGGVKHVLSHRVLHATFHAIEVQGPLPQCEEYVQVPFAALGDYALPRLVERYLAARVTR